MKVGLQMAVYRQGKWKLLLAKGSGGWTSPKEQQVPADAPTAFIRKRWEKLIITAAGIDRGEVAAALVSGAVAAERSVEVEATTTQATVDRAEVARAMALGAVGCIGKPFDALALGKQVLELLGTT